MKKKFVNRFSFEYNKDVWRAGQIRNMGKVSDSSTFSDNDWEEVKSKKDSDIYKWIDGKKILYRCFDWKNNIFSKMG